MKRSVLLPAVSWLMLSLANAASPAEETGENAMDVAGFTQTNGYFDFYWDDTEGRLWLDVSDRDEPFLYVSSLASGLGSNPVGLDRGQLGPARIVHFKRVGRRIYLQQPNLKYRADSDSEAERRAVADSFAPAIIWSGELKQTSDGKSVVDLTDFLLRDAHDCVGQLSRTGQGNFSLDENLSYLFLDRTKSFPDNTEFEATLTFTTAKPGTLARRAAADANAVTLRQHHSFVRLPDQGYRPRDADPRVGCFSISYTDFAAPIEQPTERKLITRHRLVKQDPRADVSRPIEPIVYYVDPGAPQPIREALIEGAQWWNEAFTDAGFQDAFQVRLLPKEADPMDVRYNVIQWVHRATRGWSYGQSVVDPRTGEIIKGHVLLGSQRVRQDHLLLDGLRDRPAPVNATADQCGLGAAAPNATTLAKLTQLSDSTELALARIRQLSAHEVGHTLGFSHNFAASTYAERASVMDYPAPKTRVTDGQIDLSDAYGVGIGLWDRFVIRYAYSQYAAPDKETQELASLVDQALDDGLLYISDADARPAGAAHPLANLWDNGTDPVAELQSVMQVRALALSQFDERVVRQGTALAELEKWFVPVYLHHRYQVDAVAKMLGGYHYSYTVRGDRQEEMVEVPANRQQAALEILLKTIEPKQLLIPPEILKWMPPSADSSATDRERFESRTAPIFDPVTAIEVAADLTIAALLQPERTARLARTLQTQWGLETMLTLLTKQIVHELSNDPAIAQAERVVQSVYTRRLIDLSQSSATTADVRAAGQAELKRLKVEFESIGSRGGSRAQSHCIYLYDKIVRFLERPHQPSVALPATQAPPGSPIGDNPTGDH